MSHSSIEDFTLSDGRLSRLLIATPDGAARGVVQYVHGFSEYAEYSAVAALRDFYTGQGYIFALHEQTGFGKMPGLTDSQRRRAQGVIGSYQQLLDDVTLTRKALSARFPSLPLYLHGLSMGGNIALSALLSWPRGFYKKAIIESPWLALANPLPRPVSALTKQLNRCAPRFTVGTHRNFSRFFHNEESDRFFHGRCSVRLYRELTDHGQTLLRQARQLTDPILLLQAGQDAVVSATAIQRLADKARDNVALATFPTGRHVLHTGPTQPAVFAAIAAFLKEQNA